MHEGIQAENLFIPLALRWQAARSPLGNDIKRGEKVNTARH